jgi:hypothetical protein
MQRVRREKQESLSKLSQMPTKASMGAKDRTLVKDKGAARQVTTAARAKIPARAKAVAQPTEANSNYSSGLSGLSGRRSKA